MTVAGCYVVCFCRCELSIDPHVPKKGLVKRIIGKARHPRSKAGHDQLLGDLVRLGPSGKQVVLDNLAGTWLTELTWDKVRELTGVTSVACCWYGQLSLNPKPKP